MDFLKAMSIKISEIRTTKSSIDNIKGEIILKDNLILCKLHYNLKGMKLRFLYAIAILLTTAMGLCAQQTDNFAEDHFGSGNAYSTHNSEIYNPLSGNFLNDQGPPTYGGGSGQQGNPQWNNSFSTPNNPSSLGGEMYGPLEVP